jgi:ABC-type histidine transport system ATPase subunit
MTTEVAALAMPPMVMVLCQPEAAIAPALGVLSQIERVMKRVSRRGAPG